MTQVAFYNAFPPPVDLTFGPTYESMDRSVSLPYKGIAHRDVACCEMFFAFDQTYRTQLFAEFTNFVGVGRNGVNAWRVTPNDVQRKVFVNEFTTDCTFDMTNSSLGPGMASTLYVDDWTGIQSVSVTCGEAHVSVRLGTMCPNASQHFYAIGGDDYPLEILVVQGVDCSSSSSSTKSDWLLPASIAAVCLACLICFISLACLFRRPRRPDEKDIPHEKDQQPKDDVVVVKFAKNTDLDDVKEDDHAHDVTVVKFAKNAELHASFGDVKEDDYIATTI